jgi:AcrR family transcriptional regulator
MKKQSPPQITQTEQRIKEAAREVFLKHGLENARTADIAALSKSNPSLIFYHFRSKEKLYQLVMLEELDVFLKALVPIVKDPATEFEKKVELFVEHFNCLVGQGPHVAMFVLTEMQKRHSVVKIAIKKMSNTLRNSVMAEQLRRAVSRGKYKSVSFAHVIMNVTGLTVFPVIAGPIISVMGGMKQAEYDQLVRDRQREITAWVLHMLR